MTVNRDALQSLFESPSSREVCYVIRTGFRNDQIAAEGMLSNSRITIKSAGSIGLSGDSKEGGKEMKATWIMTSLFSGLFFLAGFVPVTVSDADALEIKRVRCRVSDGPQLQVSVSVRDVDAMDIDVTITKGESSETIYNQMPDSEGDVEVEWDSAANAEGEVFDDGVLAPADEGTRATIAAGFAGDWDTVTASVNGVSYDGTCVPK